MRLNQDWSFGKLEFLEKYFKCLPNKYFGECPKFKYYFKNQTEKNDEVTLLDLLIEK